MNSTARQAECPPNPWEAFGHARDAYLESASKFISSIVNTSEYAEATGNFLKASLDIAEPARLWMDKFMPQILAYYRLPSRQELNSVASRITNIEFKLDDISAKLEELTQSLRPTGR